MNADQIKRVPTFDLDTVTEVLSPGVGEHMARTAAEAALDSLGMPRDGLSREDLLRTLDHIAQTNGVVGVTARFARSRLILQWASDDYSR
jgi:hypothetical protein